MMFLGIFLDHMFGTWTTCSSLRLWPTVSWLEVGGLPSRHIYPVSVGGAEKLRCQHGPSHKRP